MNEFWIDKTVFITGHTGFKGSWLSLWLQRLGAKVVGYSLEPPTDLNLYTLANIELGMSKSFINDICNFDGLYAALKLSQPDIVFHMAAQPLVRLSYDDPIKTYQTNVMGTVFLLEAVRKVDSIKVLINITTDKCYENKENLKGYLESDPLGGYDPYSSSKACSELVTASYRNSFFNKKAIATARAGNVIGGGDWAKDRLIPDIIRAVKNNKNVFIRNPDAVRPWQHVLDPLHGYLKLASHLWQSPSEYAEGWNFGPDETEGRTVKWVADYLVQNYIGTKWVLDSQQHPHETKYLYLNCNKSKERLEWQPRFTIDDALKTTVDWYKALDSKCNMRDFTLQQINNFTTNKEN